VVAAVAQVVVAAVAQAVVAAVAQVVVAAVAQVVVAAVAQVVVAAVAQVAAQVQEALQAHQEADHQEADHQEADHQEAARQAIPAPLHLEKVAVPAHPAHLVKVAAARPVARVEVPAALHQALPPRMSTAFLMAEEIRVGFPLH